MVKGLQNRLTRYGIAFSLQHDFKTLAGTDGRIDREGLRDVAKTSALSLLDNPSAFEAFDRADGKMDGHFSYESIDSVLNTVYSDLPDAELAASLGHQFSEIAQGGKPIELSHLDAVLAGGANNEAKSVAATLRAKPELFKRIAGDDGKIDWDDFRAFAKAVR